jgi:hypothetical protein
MPVFSLVKTRGQNTYFGQVSGRWQHVAHHKAIMSIASFICKENIPPERPSLQFLEELSVQVFNDSKRIEDLENCISGYFLIPSRPVKSDMLGSAENKTNSTTSLSQIEVKIIFLMK